MSLLTKGLEIWHQDAAKNNNVTE